MLRSVFLALSRNHWLRRQAEESASGRRLSARFVAGVSVEDALAVCERLNRERIAVTLDSLGESVTAEEEARSAGAVYARLQHEVHARGLNATISLKLTQMGMAIRPELAEEIVAGLAEQAACCGGFVRIDMEASEYTEATLRITERVHARSPGSVGTVLQAYLYRTEQDAERLLKQGIRIRLCKGAYKESPEVAFASKRDVDENYVKLAKRMITSGVFCGIATHDQAIIGDLLRFVAERGIAKSSFEFQMLYGIRRDLQRKLAHDGFGVRVYVPFGSAWYPYFMRRLAERPANALFLARNYFRK